MEILIFVVAALAVLHFVYEGIVAPSLRMQARNELFELRDELRTLHIDGADGCDGEAFEMVHSSLNAYIDRLHAVDARFVYRMQHSLRKPELRRQLDAQVEVLRNARSQPLQNIGRRAGRVIERAIAVNSGGWAFLIVPVVLVSIVTVLSVQRMSRFAIKLLWFPTTSTGHRVLDSERVAA